jgi:hypothetical protein
MLEVLFEQFMLVKVFVVDNVKAIENSGEEGSQAFLLLFLSVWMFLKINRVLLLAFFNFLQHLSGVGASEQWKLPHVQYRPS